jgi:predicted nucleic acid-binding protein
MKTSLYIETSVVSYFTARLSKNLVIAGHQAATADFWERLPQYEVYISELVLQEAGAGDAGAARARLDAIKDFAQLVIDGDCKTLARTLIDQGAIPAQYPEDALHIAVASIHGIDLLVTWNFKHMNNSTLRGKIRSTIIDAGWSCPDICSPEEV